MRGYELFKSFDEHSDDMYIKSALAKILVESKIIETEELYNIDLYKINKELNKSIDGIRLIYYNHSTES